MLLTAITDSLTIVEETPAATIDLTVTISVIIALCAIVSPIFTTIINNRHQFKLKRMELKQKNYEQTVLHEIKIYEDYLKYAGRYIYHADHITIKEYGECYYLALMIAPQDLRSDMIEADNMISRYDWSAASKQFEKITSKIHEILQRE